MFSSRSFSRASFNPASWHFGDEVDPAAPGSGFVITSAWLQRMRARRLALQAETRKTARQLEQEEAELLAELQAKIERQLDDMRRQAEVAQIEAEMVLLQAQASARRTLRRRRALQLALLLADD